MNLRDSSVDVSRWQSQRYTHRPLRIKANLHFRDPGRVGISVNSFSSVLRGGWNDCGSFLSARDHQPRFGRSSARCQVSSSLQPPSVVYGGTHPTLPGYELGSWDTIQAHGRPQGGLFPAEGSRISRNNGLQVYGNLHTRRTTHAKLKRNIGSSAESRRFSPEWEKRGYPWRRINGRGIPSWVNTPPDPIELNPVCLATS